MVSRGSVALAVCAVQLFHPVTTMLLVSSLRAHWIPLTPEHTVHPRRSGHTAFHEAGPSMPYIFGGYAEATTESPETSRYVVNDLWKWMDEDWVLVDAQGDIPGPRLVSASAACHGKAYLFGGWDPQTAGTGGVILESVHEFDMTTATWTSLSCRMPDGPTSRHVAVALRSTAPTSGTILIHTHRCVDHVLLFDTASQTFTKQPTTGCAPSPRGLHTATVVHHGRTVCLFGGAAHDQTMSNECFLLDTETWIWTKLDMDGPCPTPRAGASLVAMDSLPSAPSVILFGGAEATGTGLNPRADVWALSLTEPFQWTLLIRDDTESTTNCRPPPRNAATLTRIHRSGDNDSSKHSHFLLTGGWAPFRETWDDCYVLQVTHDS